MIEHNNEKNLIFYPYKFLFFFGIFFSVATLFLLLILPYLNTSKDKIFTSIVMIGEMMGAILSFSISSLRVTIDSKRIKLENVILKKSVSFELECFYAVYCLYGKDRGVQLLFTTKPLQYKEQKQLYRRLDPYYHGKPILHKDGNVLVYTMTHFCEIRNLIQDKVPIHLQPNEPRIYW